MVQTFNHTQLRSDQTKNLAFQDYAAFVTHLQHLIVEKRVAVPLNLPEIAKQFRIDLTQLTVYMQTIAATFHLFTAINQTESKIIPQKLFPDRSTVTDKPRASKPSSPPASAAEYTLTIDELKIIADLYYFTQLRPLPLDIIQTNAVYRTILDQYPTFFQITHDTLQLTACAQYFTTEFLKCKKIKATVPKSLLFKNKGIVFHLRIV